ncbi:Uncharacterised protein [Klebsiella pneumoniae]|nr:Uncharacterised protein [Klebsiella pneumoniae]
MAVVCFPGLRTGTAAYPAGSFIWRRAEKFILSFPGASWGWGDSFMENPVFMNTLHALTGLPAYNFGKSGLRSTAVAARQGGDPFYCMPVDGVIPASGTVNLIPNVPGPHASASNGAMASIKCQLAGVDGTFNWDGMQASFTRDTRRAVRRLSAC